MRNVRLLKCTVNQTCLGYLPVLYVQYQLFDNSDISCLISKQTESWAAMDILQETAWCELQRHMQHSTSSWVKCPDVYMAFPP